MTPHRDDPADARARPGRLFVYNAGFVAPRVRRILTLAGWRLTTGLPGSEDHVGVWGQSPYAARGERMAARTGAALVRIEDAFLRSVRTGREGAPPIGLLIDPTGVHFDPARPSAIEQLLVTHPLDDTAVLDRARDAVERLRAGHLSKYNAHDPSRAAPPPGYVLVVDQTWQDASVRASNAGPETFQEMLAVARIEHPGAEIVIKAHPETHAEKRRGYFGPEHVSDGTNILTDPVSPWHLLDGAIAVYTMSSQLGFEAILAGHRPRVFGQPFYAGWGLTQDERPVARRERRLTRAQLAAVALILAPTWYDPCRDRLCEIEEVLDQLEARSRAFRQDRNGYVATGIRLWKRDAVQGFFGKDRALRFVDPPSLAARQARKLGLPLLAWAGAVTQPTEQATANDHTPLVRIEDGFLRSRGLGAELVPPLSLVADDLGIYYDPKQESRLERLIVEAAQLSPELLRRAERLIRRLAASGVTKYNVGGPYRVGSEPEESSPNRVDPHSVAHGEASDAARADPAPEERARILVPGQVEDDASILTGCTGPIRTNLGLLDAVRAQNPSAIILYKPHPDVEAGLRPGAIPAADVSRLADAVLRSVDAAAALETADQVWTLTSAIGFEALLRGVPVTCLGAPFYAGWGLTTDQAPTPPRRTAARPSIAALVHATLITYPRYRDPVTGALTSAEVILDRLATGRMPQRSAANRLLAKAQGWMSGHAHLWRR